MKKRAAGAIGIALIVTLAVPATAFAAGSGYGPGDPDDGPGVGQLPGTVEVTQTIGTDGGVASAHIEDSTITVTIPSGAFPKPTQLVVTDAGEYSVKPHDGYKSVVTFGVGFYIDGRKVTGTFSAVAVTVKDDSIGSGSTVFFLTGDTLQPVSATTSTGTVTLSISSDPLIEIVSKSPETLQGTKHHGDGDHDGDDRGTSRRHIQEDADRSRST